MADQKPSVGRIVHYVSYGTPPGPGGYQKYTSQCRAAIITEVTSPDAPIGLCVLNPTGLFLNQGVEFHDGKGQAGSEDCVQPQTHGNPFRYCACGWTEDEHRGGTWHWPELV